MPTDARKRLRHGAVATSTNGLRRAADREPAQPVRFRRRGRARYCLRAGVAAACVALSQHFSFQPRAARNPRPSCASAPRRCATRTPRSRTGASRLAELGLARHAPEQTRAGLARLQARTQSIAEQRAEADQSLQLARRTLAVSQQRLARPCAPPLRAGRPRPDGRPRRRRRSTRRSPASRTSPGRAPGPARDRAGRGRRGQADRGHEAPCGQEAQARRAEAATAATLAALEAARREQAASSPLRAERSSNSSRSRHSNPRPASSPRRPPHPSVARGPGTLTVTATGYTLRAGPATGVSVGYGIVAVDPGVIPLGTRMTIPGYGEGVAADTGGGSGRSRDRPLVPDPSGSARVGHQDGLDYASLARTASEGHAVSQKGQGQGATRQRPPSPARGRPRPVPHGPPEPARGAGRSDRRRGGERAGRDPVRARGGARTSS